jgi:hypothetical protein
LVLSESIEELDCSDNIIFNLEEVIYNIEDMCISNIIFNNLRILKCDNCHLTTLPLLPMNLETLSCAKNLIHFLPELPMTLVELNCSYNQIICINNLPDTIEYFYCSHNLIHTITYISKNLKYIDCSYNKLTCLDFLINLRNIEKIYCHYNCLQNIPKKLRNVYVLDVSYNSDIKHIPYDFPNTIYDLNIKGTSIERLENINSEDIYIHYDEKLKYIDNIEIKWLKHILFTWKRYIILKKYQRKIKRRYLQKVSAIKIIQNGCHNWIWKPKCKDGTLGIRLRLDCKYLDQLFNKSLEQ